MPLFILNISFYLILSEWCCNIAFLPLPFDILVRPEYLENDKLRFYAYTSYESSSVAVAEGKGEYEIFYENGVTTEKTGVLRFNRGSSRWETEVIDMSALPKGEYFNMVCIWDEAKQRVCKRLFFHIGYESDWRRTK